jgi:hypothetical protein
MAGPFSSCDNGGPIPHVVNPDFAAVFSGNTRRPREMTFAGIKDAQPRADLLAFLKEAQKGSPQTAQQEGGPMGGMMGGMGGMMGGGQVPNLKKLYSAQRVQTITYCKDTSRTWFAARSTRSP